MFPLCKCFFDDLSVASRRWVQCTRVINGWMTLNPHRLREQPPRPCLRWVTVKSFNPSWFNRRQTKVNSNELAWVFFKFNIIVHLQSHLPHLQLYLNTVPCCLYCLYLIFLLLSFYYVLSFVHQAANLFASEKGFGNKAISDLYIWYKTLKYPKYAPSSLLLKIKSTYFFMGYFFFFFTFFFFYLSTHHLPNQPALGSLTGVGPVELPVARKRGRILPRPTSPPLS